jgi:hypothetical protein
VSAQRHHVVKLSEHPRALRSIRRVRALGGLAALALVALLSLRAGVPPFDAGVRALAAGIAGYVIAWTCALQAWRQIAVAELRAARRAALERRRAAEEAAAEA